MDKATNRTDAIRGPIDIRSVSLVMLATFSCIYLLYWAQSILIPIVFSLLCGYALNPIVKRLSRWGVPRALSAALLLVMIVGGLSWLGYSLRDETMAMIDQLPTAAKRIKWTLKQVWGESGKVIEKVQEAADEIQEVTGEDETSDETSSGEREVARVQIDEARINIRDYLWGGSMGLVTTVSQAMIVILMIFFFLAYGHLYKHKLVRIAGPALEKKKITVQILNDLNTQIQGFLLVMVVSIVFVGVLTWLAFLWIGMENPAVWGVAAGLLCAIPYIGPSIIFVGSAVMALLQFGSVGTALGVAFISLIITSIQGFILMPMLASKASSINAVAMFIGLMFWGWIWGTVGLLLAVPMLMVVKACCDRIENLQPLGELLGE